MYIWVWAKRSQSEPVLPRLERGDGVTRAVPDPRVHMGRWEWGVLSMVAGAGGWGWVPAFKTLGESRVFVPPVAAGPCSETRPCRQHRPWCQELQVSPRRASLRLPPWSLVPRPRTAGAGFSGPCSRSRGAGGQRRQALTRQPRVTGDEASLGLSWPSLGLFRWGRGRWQERWVSGVGLLGCPTA